MSVRGFKLPTKFYTWFRKNVERIALLADQQNASAQHIATQLGWTRAVDIKVAIDLIKKHGAAIHNGDWTGVEKDLFANLCLYYLDLPSVRRALHELGDSRVTAPPPAPRKRASRKRTKRVPAGQGTDAQMSPIEPQTAIAPSPPPATPPPAPKPPPAQPPAPNAFRKAQSL